jgi:hypothetical protein
MDKKKIKLKVGDIITFELEPQKYGFARVLSKMSLGDAIEIFDFFSNTKEDYTKAIKHPLLFDPIILDAHSLFWRRFEGDWDLMKRDDTFVFERGYEYKYKYGPKGFYKLIDLNGKEYIDISQKEAEEYPNYVPYGDFDVKHRVNFMLNKK